MFGSDILDIAIGLVLVYLIFSVLMTSVAEAVESILKTRAGQLENAIAQLLQGDQSLLEQFYNHPLIYGLYRGEYPAKPGADGAAAGPTKPRHGTHLPSYIPREIFSAAMIDILKNAPEQAEKLHQAIHAAAPGIAAVLDAKIVDPATETAAHISAQVATKRRAIEQWFDGAMDRASGAFKRHTHTRLFVMGLGIALICNINSVTIAQYLATHKPQLAAMVDEAKVASAAALPAAPGADQDAWIKSYRAQIEGIGLPIGWSEATVQRVGAMFPEKGET